MCVVCFTCKMGQVCMFVVCFTEGSCVWEYIYAMYCSLYLRLCVHVCACVCVCVYMCVFECVCITV